MSKSYCNYRTLQADLNNGVQDFDFGDEFPVESRFRRKVRNELRTSGIKFFESHEFGISYFRFHVSNRAQAEYIAGLGARIASYQADRKACVELEKRAAVLRRNKLRKLMFLKPLAVPCDGLTKQELMNSFMVA